MGHIYKKVRTDPVGNRAHSGEIDDVRDGRPSSDDQLRVMLHRQRLQLVIIQFAILRANTVLDGVEPLARLVRGRAMGQVTAGVQGHAKDRVAGLDQRLKHSLVGLRTCEMGEGLFLEPVNRLTGT